MSDYERKSIIAPYIGGLLEEKRANGYSYKCEEAILNRFDAYCVLHNLETVEITKDFLAGWMEKRDTEGSFNQAKRSSCVSQLLKYMASCGIQVYLPHNYCHFKRALPHIFDSCEIQEFFDVLDNYVPNNKKQAALRVQGEYRLLFRWYLCCGLRNSEAAGIRTENVDLETGVIKILNSKGQKDRLVYLPDDLTESCRKYYPWVCETLGYESEWFFPAYVPDKPLQDYAVDGIFSTIWNKTKFADCKNRPTVHDFRFTFVVNRINTWAAQDFDLGVMIPYLSRHLGHKTTKETLYYYSLVKEAYSVIAKKDTVANTVIPEVDYEQFDFC